MHWKKLATTCVLLTSLSAQRASLLAPIDPQVIRDQDDMTWDDYRPIPNTSWADPARRPTGRDFRIAIVTADFEDQPFVMTLPTKSDLYGNPQIPPVKREEIPQFYADFWNKPQSLNRGHTIHEYWMEQSRGSFGINVKAFGPYRMSKKYFQYGMPQGDMPDGFTADRGMNPELDALWKADAGADINTNYDVVLRIFAGYDETCVWLEFGAMKFQNADSIPAEWGNPDPTKPRFVKTRYTDWTSWRAGSWLWSNSAILQGESSGSIRHEISHFAFRIGDNNNNPYVTPYRRTGAGPWDIMDRGSFNGPGGPHRRWLIPVMEGGAAPAGLMLRQKLKFGFIKEKDVLSLERTVLATTGLAVANVTARAAAPLAGSIAGILVKLDGAAPQDRTPVDDPATNPLSSGNPNYNNYTVEVVQRVGYDSFTPDSGVLIAKNKDTASTAGGPNAFSVFNWVIDAHPEDINKLDFKRPNGEAVLRTIADYRQLNDALFHAGLNSGSSYEWEDTPNRLHFYVTDIQRRDDGILTYGIGVRSLDGAGPQRRGLMLAEGKPAAATCGFKLTNTGAADAGTPAHLGYDIYRLRASATGLDWNAAIPNALAAVKFGGSVTIQMAFAKGTGKGTLTLEARSESDPKQTATAVCTVQ